MKFKKYIKVCVNIWFIIIQHLRSFSTKVTTFVYLQVCFVDAIPPYRGECPAPAMVWCGRPAVTITGGVRLRRANSSLRRHADECRQDADCAHGFICCLNQCGSRSCVDEAGKPGPFDIYSAFQTFGKLRFSRFI